MIINYVLDSDKNPIPATDILAWGAFMEDLDSIIVAKTFVEETEISTVFLGTDCNFSRRGRPILWETLVFGGPMNHYQMRYRSHEEALRGHAKTVRMVRRKYKEKSK